jgi:ribosomal protein S4
MFGNFLVVKSKRAFRLNKAILSLGRRKLWAMANSLELNIVNVLVSSRLIYSSADAKNFLSNGYVYVNRRAVNDAAYVLKKGDVLELVFSKLYFIYLSRLKLVNEKVYIKMKNKL